jgi:hypothetical protein
MTHPTAGFGHNPADKEAGWTTFAVTTSIDTGAIKFLIADPKVLLTSAKMIRSVLMDALDQWLVTNAVQLVTNSVVIGNDPVSDDFGGSNANRPAGDGGLNMIFTFSGKYMFTPVITTTSLTEASITVSIPYADVI